MFSFHMRVKTIHVCYIKLIIFDESINQKQRIKPLSNIGIILTNTKHTYINDTQLYYYHNNLYNLQFVKVYIHNIISVFNIHYLKHNSLFRFLAFLTQ